MKPIQTATFNVPEYEVINGTNYRPRLASKQLRQLRVIKKRTGRPITKLLAEALDDYLDRWKGGDLNEAAYKSVESQTAATLRE